MLNVLIIIPARGGSKGIPRKNIRTLAGEPLISYSIQSALKSKFSPFVVVSTDDDEIRVISKRFGVDVINRETVIAEDTTTLDPVIFHAYNKVIDKTKSKYDLVFTLQPTSPLLRTETIDSAISLMYENPEIDTLISVIDDTHLTWKKVNNEYIPNYKKRLNRQYLEPVYKETGGFLVTRASIISEANRIGKNVKLFELDGPESIDIDSYEDWSLCEYHLKRKKILFVVSGHREIGLGHVYNTLLLANDILEHDVEFLVDNKSQLAYDKISENNYKVNIQKYDDIVDDVKDIAPDVVINDKLDTTSIYIECLKKGGFKVVNFEDLGDGAQSADLVINAIYPEQNIRENHYFGHRYFLLRDEFLLANKTPTNIEVRNVLLTFGGVDPNNYTEKVISSIYEYCKQKNINISVIVGYGYSKIESLAKYSDIQIHKNTASISDFMTKSDLIFTSAGRTIYEVASLEVPAIVLAQNNRELTHFFASSEYGFLNLGLGIDVTKIEVLNAFVEIVQSYDTRKHMAELMAKSELKNGRKRVLNLIRSMVE